MRQNSARMFRDLALEIFDHVKQISTSSSILSTAVPDWIHEHRDAYVWCGCTSVRLIVVQPSSSSALNLEGPWRNHLLVPYYERWRFFTTFTCTTGAKTTSNSLIVSIQVASRDNNSQTLKIAMLHQTSICISQKQFRHLHPSLSNGQNPFVHVRSYQELLKTPCK